MAISLRAGMAGGDAQVPVGTASGARGCLVAGEPSRAIWAPGGAASASFLVECHAADGRRRTWRGRLAAGRECTQPGSRVRRRGLRHLRRGARIRRAGLAGGLDAHPRRLEGQAHARAGSWRAASLRRSVASARGSVAARGPRAPRARARHERAGGDLPGRSARGQRARIRWRGGFA